MNRDALLVYLRDLRDLEVAKLQIPVKGGIYSAPTVRSVHF